MWRAQQRAIGDLFATMAEKAPLVEPAFSSDGIHDDRHEKVSATMAETIHRHTGLRASAHRYAGWLGVECTSVRSAIWMMRAMVASNILSRREGTVLFVPVNPVLDSAGDITARALTRIYGLEKDR